MSGTVFEQGPIRPVAVWVLTGLTLAAWVAILAEAPPGTASWMTAFVMAVAAFPVVGFAVPMLWVGRHRLRVDREGVWRDDELLVPAAEILAIGVHVQRPYGQTRYRGGDSARWGEPVNEVRLHGQGSVCVPVADVSPSSYLWTRLATVVVADGRWGSRSERRGRLLTVPSGRGHALVEALLEVSPDVDEPTQILEPQVTLGMGRSGTRVAPTDMPPLEDWSWGQDTVLRR